LIGGAVALFIIPIVLSWWNYSTYKEDNRPIEIVITQPNVEQYVERKEMPLTEQLDKMLDVAIPLITDSTLLVLGPETVVPNRYPIGEQVYSNDVAYNYLQKHVDQWNGVSIYMGVASYKVFRSKHRHSMQKYENHDLYYEQYDASILLRKETKPIFVHKSKLLLMAEKIPFAKQFPILEEYAVDLRGTAGTLGSGTKPEVLRTNGFSFAPVNCYETIYGEWVGEQTVKGAEVIFAITNDGWWGESAGHKQHNSFSRLRAIENRRYVARASMTGISSVINQRGDIIQSIPYGVHDAMRATLKLNKRQTFYAQNGDIIGILLLNIAYVLLGINAFLLVRNKVFKKSKVRKSKAKAKK
ncbi:MAG TPA: apolipoprotein N-acyltransferase, partial [Brumimicrobium sp.]|nr:apolipoprotein N-acyltransferase [Brumimicrobium sp.]